jgi:uncharacterized protein (DUF1800 family)
MRRRSMIVSSIAALAFAIALPALAAPMGTEDARHLLARTGFGPTSAEVREFAALSRDDAIERLLADVRTTPVTPAPDWAAETAPLRPTPAATATNDERKAFQQEQTRRGLEMRAWWVQEMLVTPSPLTERMTLFWHNHFVSSQQKVRVARLMYAQNAALRANALGNFGTLLHVASKDPAMVVYLDSVQNRKGAPNENFAREVMELFTLGQGHYGEQDVKEAARAFTGWSLDRESGTFVFRPRLHDDGEKTVLGSTGRFDGDGVLDLLLARPDTSEFVVGKLWQEFVSPVPDRREVQRTARAFRASHYDLKVAMRTLLRSPAFWAPEHRGLLVKNPVDIVVGTLRQLELTPPDTRAFALAAVGMGQNLFAPPNVRGWPGGETWINSNTLLARKQYLDRIARNDADVPPALMKAVSTSDATDMATPAAQANAAAPAPEAAGANAQAARIARGIERGLRSVRFDAAAWLSRRDGDTRDARLDDARALLLPIPAQLPAPMDADATTAVHALLLDPAYQLK